MNRVHLFVLCLGIIFFLSCKDDSHPDDELKADLPELSFDSVSMSGVIGIHNAVMFSINNVPFIGLGRIPVVGDNINFYYYSPENRRWEQIAEYPGGVREGAVAFVIGNKAYVGLGTSLLGDIETGYSMVLHDDFFVYDNESGTWDAQPIKFPGGPRSGAVAFSIGGKGYVGTGYGENNSLDRFADFYEFNPETGWTQVANIARPRAGAHAFVANGYAYVCFGSGMDDIQKFDPKSKSWKGQPICYEEGETAELQPFIISSFVLNKDGKDFVYVGGGWGYNPQENIWKKTDYRLNGEYAFTIGEKGYSMRVNEDGGGFSAWIFEVVK